MAAALIFATAGVIWFHRNRRRHAAAAMPAAGRPQAASEKEVTLETLRAVEHAVSRTLAVAVDDAAAIAGVVSTLCERLHWEWGAWWHYDEDLLQRQYLWSTPALAQSPLTRQRVLILPATDGAMSRVLRQQRPAWAGHLPDAAAGREAQARAAGLRTMLLIPVSAGDTCFGLLELFGTRPCPDVPALTATAAAIGAQTGQALQRAAAERQRRETVEQLSTITANIPSAVFRFHVAADQAQRFSFISAHVARLCGLPAERILEDPQALQDLLSREHQDRLQRACRLSLDTGGEWDCEFEITPPDGQPPKWLRLQARPQRHADGGASWDGVLSDITDRKRAELEIVRMNLELEERIALRTREYRLVIAELESFAYSVSHDLRAPLRAMHGYAKIMLDEHGAALPASAQEYLRHIEAAGLRMGELIDALLALSRLTRQELQPETVDLSALAATVAGDLQRMQPHPGLQLRIQPGLLCQADPRMLHILLTNLLGNAWKFTRRRRDACIELGAVTQDGNLVYHVRDNGAGFDEQYADRLFEPFQRLHDSREFEGTGIGLATVQRVVQRHDGRIWAQGTPGHGATFYFTLAKPRASR